MDDHKFVLCRKKPPNHDGVCSASCPNSRKVRATRSIFSRNPFAVRRANRTVDVVKVLTIGESVNEGKQIVYLRDKDIVFGNKSSFNCMRL